jgi:carboxymethylenebutenolidase
MKPSRLFPLCCAAALAACAPEPAPAPAPGVAGLPAATSLPAGTEAAEARLRGSPRHGEWVSIPVGTADSVRAWVVYPERSSPAPVVLVVHEIYGLTHWIRGVADQLAAEGFVAIAPDLLTGRGVATGATGEPDREAAVAAVRALPEDEVHTRLAAAAEWGKAQPSTTGSYGIVGFCWGGTVSFVHAVRAPGLGASVVYYGGSPATERLGSVRAPVLGLYAGDDARVNTTVPPADSAMRALGRSFEVRMYDGAGHGFLRQQDGRDGANLRATEQAWPETVRWFRTHLR